MYVTLFDGMLPPPVPKRARRRRAPRDGHTKYTRHPGRGMREQLRVWLTGYGSINCGLYDPEMVASVRRQLAAESGKYPATPLGLWRALRVVLDAMQAQGIDTPSVLPKWVEPIAGGYFAKVRKAGRVLETDRYATPEETHEAMIALLVKEFPEEVRDKREYVTLLDFITESQAIVC